jgi:hypothetical protein
VDLDMTEKRIGYLADHHIFKRAGNSDENENKNNTDRYE